MAFQTTLKTLTEKFETAKEAMQREGKAALKLAFSSIGTKHYSVVRSAALAKVAA